MLKGRDAVSVALLIAAVVFVSAMALDYRAAPERFQGSYLDRTALRHVDGGEKHGRKVKVRKRLLDPRTEDERGLDELDARIRLLWAKVERLETTLLHDEQEEERKAYA